MSVRSLCNTTVNVQYVTNTKDGEGGTTEAWTARHASMPCRIQPISGSELAMYRSNRMKVTHKMFVPPDYAGILPTDRVVRGSVIYNITLVRDIDLMGHHLEMLLEDTTEAIE